VKGEKTLAELAQLYDVHANQITSLAFTGILLRDKIACRMDGRGAWRDNVIVERLWRLVKYEEVYLRAYSGVSEARASITRYLSFHNGKRPHSRLAAKTPDQAYFDNLLGKMAACGWRPICHVTPVGLSPPCMTHHIGISRKQPADDPLIHCQSLCRQTEPPLRSSRR